jgi:hypothetical protein
MLQEQDCTRAQIFKLLSDQFESICGTKSRMIEWKDKESLSRFSDSGVNIFGLNIILNSEVLVTGVNFGGLGDAEHRFESNAKASDLSLVVNLCALKYIADAADIRFCERQSKVSYF